MTPVTWMSTGRRASETMVMSATASNCREADGVARETAPVPHRVSCPAFVGRAEELDVLEATLARVAAGAAATVLVAGDAGIGKTRLVDEFCGRARGGGAWWRPACASRSRAAACPTGRSSASSATSCGSRATAS